MKPIGGARLIRALAMLTLASLFFLSGYVFAETGPAALRLDAFELLRSIGLDEPLGRLARAASSQVEVPLPPEDQESLRILWEAWSRVKEDFYEPGKLDSREMARGAVRGMLRTLDDPHTLLLDPSERQISEAELRGSFQGIGVQVEMVDRRLRIVTPLENSPGERAGLVPGDVITHVDGKDVRPLTLQEAVTLIRGPSGTSLSLTIEREGELSAMTVNVERADIKVTSVRWSILEGDVGYVRISTFGTFTSEEVAGAVRQIMATRPSGLVLDLRNNPGGFLSSAVDVASQFVSEGSVVLQQQDARGEVRNYLAKAGGLATGVSMVVLINQGSASASEIVAAAVRDNQRGLLLGQKSFGKGTVQNQNELSDGSGLRITIARWLTPDGEAIHGEGLMVDLEVEGPPVVRGGPDPQVEAAIRQLHGQALRPAA